MFLLAFFVAWSHVVVVIDALFGAGAGRMGGYVHCSWQLLGQGQLRALEGSLHFFGQGGVFVSVE
ncbi:NGG1p interacting factor NIF3, partial [Pseudomonas syringae pv. tagetis]